MGELKQHQPPMTIDEQVENLENIGLIVEDEEYAKKILNDGGMNSVSEALVYGTPMVVIPFVSDQPVNARCIEKLGVGKRLEYSDANKDTLKEYVMSVLLDKDIKGNIVKVQKMIRQAPGNIGGAEVIIDYYNNL